MMLTPENYYKNTNPYLSNSKISLFKKDKKAFYDRYITGEAEKETSTALTIGKAFDLLMTGSEEHFNNCYEMKVLKKDNPELFEKQKTTNKKLLTPSQYNEITGMYNTISNCPIFDNLKGFDTQMILKYDMPINERFKGICGIPDYVKIEGDTCHLYDLKTSRVFAPIQRVDEKYSDYKNRVAKTYTYKCKDYGYFNQLAMYRFLLRKKFPNLKNFIIRHITIEKAEGLNYPVWVFRFPDKVIDNAEKELFSLIDIIKIEKEFKANPKREIFKPNKGSFKNEITLNLI